MKACIAPLLIEYGYHTMGYWLCPVIHVIDLVTAVQEVTSHLCTHISPSYLHQWHISPCSTLLTNWFSLRICSLVSTLEVLDKQVGQPLATHPVKKRLISQAFKFSVYGFSLPNRLNSKRFRWNCSKLNKYYFWAVMNNLLKIVCKKPCQMEHWVHRQNFIRVLKQQNYQLNFDLTASSNTTPSFVKELPQRHQSNSELWAVCYRKYDEHPMQKLDNFFPLLYIFNLKTQRNCLFWKWHVI